MKKIVIIIISVVLVTMSLGCNLLSDGEDKVVLNASSEQMVVKVTNYPLYFFTVKVAGSKINVENLLPPGIEPHGFEPSPRDLIELEKADLLIYNGAGLEDWIINTSKALDNKELEIIDASEGIELICNGEEGDEFDPHLWLDPINCKKIVSNILEALIEKDPADKDFFIENAQLLIEQLENLDMVYKEELENCSKKIFVVNHASFGYLAKRYGLQQMTVMGINPHTEPTPQKAGNLVKLLLEYDLKYIFTETLVSSKVAEVLANEAGISTKILNPLGNLTDEDIKAGKDYFSIMYENLAALKEGLT